MNAPAEAASPLSSGRQFKRILSRLKDAKELVTAVAFFAGGLVWVVNYFATRDALDGLDCFTRVNVRILTATANVNETTEQAKASRSELREQQRLLKETQERANAPPDDVKAIQTQIDELEGKANSFSQHRDAEEKAGTKWLAVLTNSLCYQKEYRQKILSDLSSGQ